MKNKTGQIIAVYILTSLFIAIISFKLLKSHTSDVDPYFFNFIKDLIFIISAGLLFKHILSKNDKRNTIFYENLQKTNGKIKESNEKYDIVAKATSDTIWDWNIPEDLISWNNEIYGYNQT